MVSASQRRTWALWFVDIRPRTAVAAQTRLLSHQSADCIVPVSSVSVSRYSQGHAVVAAVRHVAVVPVPPRPGFRR
ncbi:hypothetical protein J6590_045679 [Homalodisca vitripennis]|nr:hypothetical protein J6590_045679 [Homalodisca vitripennis]